MQPDNTTNKLYKLIDNALGNQLPRNVQSLCLKLDVDSPPMITITFISNNIDVDVDTVTQQFEIKELPSVNQ